MFLYFSNFYKSIDKKITGTIRSKVFPLLFFFGFFSIVYPQSVLQIGSISAANSVDRLRLPVFLEQNSPVSGLQFQVDGHGFLTVDSVQMSNHYSGLAVETWENKVIVFHHSAQKIIPGPDKFLELFCRIDPVLSDTTLPVDFIGNPVLSSPLGQAVLDVTFCSGQVNFFDGAAVSVLLGPRYRYRLDQNYPNPFNPQTIIPFAVEKSGRVRLRVYDISGRLVQTLVDKNLPPGEFKTTFTPDLPSGVYFYNLQAGTFTQTGKMVFVQ
ncbi:T9SS type A sorting domain-containing protein [candidate division KSB1 bacterium]|nr:T9SS type A sorting domain-containing protein [candidate division KSB1 bacterium]